MVKKGKGMVVAVCISSKPNVPKYPQKEVEVGEYGLAGDIHAGPTRISRRDNKPKFNDRQISIMAQEDLDFLNAELGIELKPGDMGENIVVQGLGSMSEVTAGQSVRIGRRIVLEITEQNEPCYQLSVYHRLLAKVSRQTRRRGVLAIVKAGCGFKIRPNNRVSLYP